MMGTKTTLIAAQISVQKLAVEMDTSNQESSVTMQTRLISILADLIVRFQSAEMES
tara:strand:- start:378 stop:545 length:168 start_codon:yes stop_codon:yes gene_type:complete